MKKYLLKLTGAFALIGMGILFFAFTPSGGEELGDTFLDTRGCQLSVSFMEQIDSRVKIPDGDYRNLHPFEKLDLKKTSEQYQVNRCFDERSQLSTERILLNTNKRQQTWRDAITRVVINPQGTELYSSKGKLIKKVAASKAVTKIRNKQAAILSNSKNSGKPIFPIIITEQDIDSRNRENKDVTIFRLKNGNLSVRKDMLLKTNGVQMEKISEYKQIARDTYVPIVEQTKTLTTSSLSDTCMEKIETKTFSDYVINGQRVH